MLMQCQHTSHLFRFFPLVHEDGRKLEFQEDLETLWSLTLIYTIFTLI